MNNPYTIIIYLLTMIKYLLTTNIIVIIVRLTNTYMVLLRFNRVLLSLTPQTVACQSPLSMGFSRPEYWSRLPFPSPRDLSDPGIETASPAWQADSVSLSHLGSPINILSNS